MYQLRYEELHPQFGTSVRGIDLGKPLTPDLIQEINAEINRYSFVFFPDQSMDDDRQLAQTGSRMSRPRLPWSPAQRDRPTSSSSAPLCPGASNGEVGFQIGHRINGRASFQPLAQLIQEASCGSWLDQRP